MSAAPAGEGPLARLRALGLELPAPPDAVAAYAPVTVVPIGEGRVLMAVSGQVVHGRGVATLRGSVPSTVSVEAAVDNARSCALNVLAQIERAVGLDNLEQVLQLTVFVCSDDGFEAQPRVADGASDLLVAVLGERGRHARIATGVNALPLGVPVEVAALAVARRPTPA
ncbi:MAG TPA: RidA family protein [Candidatus Angelobacter sp.]|nr:RidA family protein [Candidatus Angelobacter sp.]